MTKKIQYGILFFLPFLVFIPLFFISRSVHGMGTSAYIDWAMAIGCSFLVLFNPLLKNFKTTWSKLLAIGGSFVLCILVLVALSFAIMAFAFGEGP